MGDRFAAPEDVQRLATAEAASETVPSASSGPLPLPEGAQPVRGVTGYHALIKGSAVTVYGPDGTEIASGRRKDGLAVGLVGVTRLVSDGFGDARLTAFAELAARHHRAAADPDVRDRVWVRWEEDGVAAVYGTDKHGADDRRAVKAGNLYWSGQRQGWATGRKWNPATRDRNLAAVLLAFARQDRNVVVLGPGQEPEDLGGTPGAAAAAAAAAPQVPPAAAEPDPEPEPVYEPEDFTGLSYEDLVAAEQAAATERSRRYTTTAEARYLAVQRERGQRLLDRVASSPPVGELSGEDLAAEVQWWDTAIYKTPWHSSHDNHKTMEQRRNEVTAEQHGRTARVLLSGPAVVDLDDAALESAYEQIGQVWSKMRNSHELHEQVVDFRKAAKEERTTRRARSYGERIPVGEMPLEDLVAEHSDLESMLAARNEQSAYSYSETIKDARAARLLAVEEEWDRRGLEQHPDAARAELGSSIGGRRPVHIDGSTRSYGYMERQGKKFRALANYDMRSGIGDFDSGPAAMAALVQRYDQDPETLPRRTWGRERLVMLPSSSYDPLVSWLRRRPEGVSREFARVLTLLTPYELPTQTKVLNPLTDQVMRAYPFAVEEGLLGELARIAERTTEDLREQSLNEELPKREREAAKRRIPAMGAALIGINAVIEQVRAAGGDAERRGVDQGRMAAQMAALTGTVDQREGGEADGDEQPVRDAAAAALGGVPAPGAGVDAGPGGVLPDAGDADGRGDRTGGGGPGGGPGTGDALPGPGGTAPADRGDSAGAGAARDAAGAGERGSGGGPGQPGGDGAGVDPQGAGEPVARFRPDPADLPRGPLARAEANLAAVQLLRELERGRRGATLEEKRVLNRWSGWGSVPIVFFDEPDIDEPTYQDGGEREGQFETDHAHWESYSRVRGELHKLLSPFEWRAATRAVLSAHYTPQDLAEAMWQGLAAYGFDGGEALEAGCGSGAFFGVAPQNARLTGIEMDPPTAALAARIYPHANVLTESFTDTDAPAGTFDLVIGNVPFSQAPFGDRRYGSVDCNLHNGFIIKQLALLRPGAYMAVITSRWTLDGERSTTARRAMARWGDLAAAYRLPAGTFGETGDTDVVADVLVFRRRSEGEEPSGQGWVEASQRELNGHTLAVNSYFTDHPENVLGRMTSEKGPYGPRVTVQGDPGAAPRLLRERMEAAAAAAVAAGNGYTPHEDGADRPPLLLQTARDKHATDFTGRLYTDDQGRIWQHVNGADPVRVVTADGIAGTEQLRMLLSLRDVAGELQDLDRGGNDPHRATEVRGQLARLHAAYTAAYGALSRPRQTRLALPTEQAAAAARDAGVVVADGERLPTGWGWFRQDPHAAVVLGLEHWDRANDRAVLSEVLARRPGARRGDLEPTDDPKTALTAVMGATGRVDLPLIASLLGTTPEQARQQLGTEIFDNPVTRKLEHAGAYLSGPVRQKLEQAREAAKTDPTYAVNVAALETVQPPPKRLGQFTAQLGAHWIPAPLVQGFLREYLGDPTLQVSHNERYGWSLAIGKVPDAVNALKGTERRSAAHIAKALLGRGALTVGRLDGEGVDEDATRAARYKADAMRSGFEDYCTASTARVTMLTDAYNRTMNGHVVRSYDGLAPTLEGFTTERTPHPWQLSGAARMQFERGVILAHEMGLGKTTTMVMGSQALKASGQIAKPFAVVQPGLGRQWLDEAKLLYPNADIHLITSDDLADGNRRKILEWLRSNTPDLVIFTEGAFGSIRMSPERQELYVFRELESLKEQLERERGVPHNAFALMKLEQRLATVESRIRRNDAPMRNPGEVYWDDLGFDYALVDEYHRFTAVGFRSKEAGGETASVRAVDLHQKLTWHHQVAEADGGRPTVALGSGTPMENSIFEQYAGLELGTPWLLDQFGVHGPDLWSETFGQKVQRIEQAPDGSGLVIVERFSRFISKSTMKTMWGLATDTKTGDEVGIQRPRVAGGAPQLVLVEPTADQQARLKSLVARGQAIHAGDVTREEDNMLAVSGEGRAVALDPRLVDAGAPAGNKLAEAADIIAAGYHAHKDHTYAVSNRDDTPHPVPGGLFFVFANSGTPGGNNKGDFDAYAELRGLLAARGVPRDLVQFAQEHRTPERKAEMTNAANNGGIAVLVGSSEVLGTGFNGQNRAYALMHLDQDWTPAMMMQRNARAIRPGNQHEEVDIYFLATKRSMDAWQVGLLTSKAEGLRDIQRPPGVGDDDGDTVEEIGASDWDFATMAAEIGDNPFMRQFMEAKLHLQGLEADRRNAAADRVRQTELLGVKEGELVRTRLAIAARDKALPKITDTIRGDAFRIRIGGREFDRFGDAASVLRQAVTDAVRAHQNEGAGPWKKLGTFGGLDFAVQPEVAFGSGEICAYIGFPELRHSESRSALEDLLKANIGGTMLGRLATALEKAEDHQLMDRGRLPGLEKEVAVLTAGREVFNFGPAIEHARRRVELLDAVVGAITERDKLPELTESMLDPKKHPTPDSRQKAIQERDEQRAPHQAKVDAAALAVTAFDMDNPAPQPVHLINTFTEDNDTDEAFEQWRERQQIIIQQNREAGLGAPEPADEPAPEPEDGPAETAPAASAPDAAAAEQQEAPAETAPPAPAAVGVDAGATDGTTQAPEPEGDGYGTDDLYEAFGLTPPDRLPAVPAAQGEPEPEAEETPGVSDGQLTVEEVQPEAVPAGPVPAAARDDGRERLISADGRLRFTLLTVPADEGFAPEAVEAYQRRRGEFAAVVEAKNEQTAQTPAERAAQLAEWRRTFKVDNGMEPFLPVPSLPLTSRRDAPGLVPKEYGIGSWVTWRDEQSGQQVSGQVMAPGAAGGTWYVSTDRTGHTGEYHVLRRSGKKTTGYTYSLNGAAVELRPAGGPGAQLPLGEMPEVDSVPARPVTPYADWFPADSGLAPVREPIPVTVGEMGPRSSPAEVAFDVTADGIPFVVRLSQNDDTLTSTYVPRVESGGKVLLEMRPLYSRAEAVDLCVAVARVSREMADKPLRANYRDHDLDLAEDGVCGPCSVYLNDNDEKQLYRLDGGNPECIEHLTLKLGQVDDIAGLARARRIWAARVDPDTAAAADTTASAGAEQSEESPAAAPAEQEAAAPAATREPHEVDREVLRGGDRISVTVSGRAIEWDAEAWGLPVPETAIVAGTVYPGYLDYRQNASLLDAVIRDQTGKEVAAADRVFVRQLPEQVQLLPAEHRDDLRPEPRTVGQVRVGDLIAEGGLRGEAVTELRYVSNPRGSMLAVSTRDVATGDGNSFILAVTREVAVVPRERRPAGDVVPLFGRHTSHDQIVAEVGRTFDLDAAVAEITTRVWPNGAGPQDEMRALNAAVGAIDPARRGTDAYRANAAAMQGAAAAAAALFAAADDDFLNRYVGLPLYRLLQHLDAQAHRLHASAAHLDERAASLADADTASAAETASTRPGEENRPEPNRPTDLDRKGESAVSQSAETEQLGLFGDPAQDPAEPGPVPATGSGAAPTEDRRGAQLQAALIEGETIVPVSFTDWRRPAPGWILTTAGGHTFRLRPVPYSGSNEDQWEAGHDAGGSYWWAADVDDHPLTAVLARIREDTATRTRFASLWARYGHLTAQVPQFETATDRVELEEGVYLIRRFGRIGLIASCRWGWEHLTDPDGAQGRTSNDWSRRGLDNRQYVAEWKIWHSAQDAIPTARLRVVAQLTDDTADTPDAYCDASQPYVGKCSAKRSGARYTVAVVTDQEVELGHYTVCARCLSHRLVNDEDRQIGHLDVQNLAEALAKGDPKACDLNWKQWPDRIAELAGQMLSAALDAGETAPWPAQALTGQIIAEASAAGDDRAMREARAEVKAAGGNARAQKQAAEEAVAARQDRAALVARHEATLMEAPSETALGAVATLELAGPGVEGGNAAPEPAEEAPVVVNVDTLTVSPQVRNGKPSTYEFTVTGPGLIVGEYEISHDAQGKGARGIMWQAWWHGVEPSGHWDVISIGSGEGQNAALAAVAEHAATAGGDLAAGFTVARRMYYDAGLWLLPDVAESEAIQYHPDGSWTITAETGAPYTVRREWRGRDATNDLAPLLIEDQAGALVASCTAVDGYMSAWAPMLDRLRLHATAVADEVPHATAVTLGGPTQEWVEAWCVCSWTERTDVAKYADRASAGEALALAHRQAHPSETSTTGSRAPLQAATVVTPTLDEVTAAAELPELDVVLLDVDVPPPVAAEPYSTDEEAQADIDRLSEVFARWAALPTVQRYYEADRQLRPDGNGTPTNPLAQLAAAYEDAAQTLRDGPAGPPDDLIRQVNTVAAWSSALEPVVSEDLRGPLEEVREAAALLAARSQATIESFEAELAALAADSGKQATTTPDTEPTEQAETGLDTGTTTSREPVPEHPAADPDEPSHLTSQEPQEAAPAEKFQFSGWVYHNAQEYWAESMSADGLTVHTAQGDLPAREVTAAADMPKPTRRALTDLWDEWDYQGRTYTVTNLPPELRGRLGPVWGVIVDDQGELVGRTGAMAFTNDIIWAHAHPGVLRRQVADILRPGDWEGFPEYTAEERAYVEAGPHAAPTDGDAEAEPEQSSTELTTGTDPAADPPSRPAQMTFDLDAALPPETGSGSETEADETVAPAGEQMPPAEQPLPAQAEEPAETAPVPAPTTDATGDSLNDDETTQNTPEESTMATAPVPETADAPSEPPAEEPPAPQRYFETAALAGDPGYRLRLSGLDGQPVDSGDVLHGDLVIATVHPGAEGGWFARLVAEGLPADVTYLTDGPQDAAAQAAVLYSAFTRAPYGLPPGAAVGDETRQRVDALRADLRDAAVRHRDAVASAAVRAYPGLEQNEHFGELIGSLDGLAAAVSEGYGSQQMTQYLNAVQGAVTNWGGSLPADPGHPERRQLAFPLAHLLYDSRRLQEEVRTTLDAVQAERAAAAREQQAAAEQARDDSAQQTPAPVPEPASAPERVRGPVVALSLWDTEGGYLNVGVEHEEAEPTYSVLPDVTVADTAGLDGLVTVEVPLLTRPAGREHQLVSDDETEDWLAEHLPNSELAPAWSSSPVRARLVVVVRDTLRDVMAPTLDDIADWLVETATEHDELLRAAHTASSLEEFAPAFARVADAQVTADGSEHLIWRYSGGNSGSAREAVLALAVERAHERLLAEDAPAEALAPEQAVSLPSTEPAAPRPDAPEDPEMATPARPTTPENREASEPSGELPLWTDPETSGPADGRPVDGTDDFAAVQEAWDEHVPASQGTGADLFASVEDELLRLEALFADAVAKMTPTPEPQEAPEAAPGSAPALAAGVQHSPEPAAAEPEAAQEDSDPQQRASAVNTALREADTHAPTLQDLPEWQELQTVRGAVKNLWNVIKEKAGDSWDRLIGDARVQRFFRTVSIRACDAIAGWAQAGADRLRDHASTTNGDSLHDSLPTAQALLALGDTAAAYSATRGNGPGPVERTRPGNQESVAALRALGAGLERADAKQRNQKGRVSASAAKARSAKAPKQRPAPAAGAVPAVQPAHLRRPAGDPQNSRAPRR